MAFKHIAGLRMHQGQEKTVVNFSNVLITVKYNLF